MVSCIALFAVATLGGDPLGGSDATTTSAPTAEKAAGAADTYYHDEFTFTDPPEGWLIYRQADGQWMQFINEKEHAVILIDLEPKDMILTGMGPQMAKAVDGLPAQKGGESVMHAKIEKDKRFDLKIHDKYKIKGETGDQLHLYRSIGPRVVEVDVASSSPDQTLVDDAFDTAQTMFAGMKFDKKAFLKQKKIEDDAARQQKKQQQRQQ
jgi:hypothetical protein